MVVVKLHTTIPKFYKPIAILHAYNVLHTYLSVKFLDFVEKSFIVTLNLVRIKEINFWRSYATIISLKMFLFNLTSYM
jgi:hypothetical protein